MFPFGFVANTKISKYLQKNVGVFVFFLLPVPWYHTIVVCNECCCVCQFSCRASAMTWMLGHGRLPVLLLFTACYFKPAVTSCSAGWHGSSGGICKKCSAGSYSAVGAVACTPCAAGTYAAALASTACSACAASTASAAESSSCTLRVPGAFKVNPLRDIGRSS